MSSSRKSFRSGVLGVPIYLDQPMLIMELVVELTGKHRENFLREIFAADSSFNFVKIVSDYLNFISDDRDYKISQKNSILSIVEELKFQCEQERPLKKQKKKVMKPTCIVEPSEYGRIDIYDGQYQYIYDLSEMSPKDQHRLCYRGYDPITGRQLSPIESDMEEDFHEENCNETAYEEEEDEDGPSDVLVITSTSLRKDAETIDQIVGESAGGGETLRIHVPPRIIEKRKGDSSEDTLQMDAAVKRMFHPEAGDGQTPSNSPTYAPDEPPPFDVQSQAGPSDVDRVPKIIRRDLKALQNSRLDEFIIRASNFKQKFRCTRIELLESKELDDITSKYFGKKSNDLFRMCGRNTMRMVASARLKKKKKYQSFIAEIAPLGLLEIGADRVVE